MATSRFLRSMVLLVLCTLSVTAFNCKVSPVVDKCTEYFNQGGTFIWLQDLTDVNEFDQDMEDRLTNAIAEIANDYVILEVTAAEHVAKTQLQVVNDRIQVGFFILNPSGSEKVPTAFRAPELFLMLKLNDGRLEELFGQKVKAIDPKPEPLIIPIYAVAILGYVGLVVLCAVGLYATGDWRRRKQHELEESLSMSSMEKGNGHIPMNGIKKTRPMEKKPIVVYAEAGVQTERGSRGITKAKSKEKSTKLEDNNNKQEETEPTSNGHTVHATIENGVDDKQEPVPDVSPAEETTKDTDTLVGDEDHHDDAKASDDEKGADNTAFNDDEEDESKSSDEETGSEKKASEDEAENQEDDEIKDAKVENEEDKKEESDENKDAKVENNEVKEEEKGENKEAEVEDAEEKKEDDDENKEEDDGSDEAGNTQF